MTDSWFRRTRSATSIKIKTPAMILLETFIPLCRMPSACCKSSLHQRQLTCRFGLVLSSMLEGFENQFAFGVRDGRFADGKYEFLGPQRRVADVRRQVLLFNPFPFREDDRALHDI